MEFVPKGVQPGEVPVDYSLVGGDDHLKRGRRLFQAGLLALAAMLGYFGYTAKVDNQFHLVLGLAALTLSALPALLWARTGGNRFPVFESIMALCANAYALPLLNAREQLAGYASEVITQAGFTVLLYQGVAIVVYNTVRGEPGRARFWRESIITSQVERLMVYGLVLSCIYVWMSELTSWIPHDLVGPLRAVFYGITTLCTFVTAQRWGRNELRSDEKVVFMCFLIPQMFLMSVGLLLIGTVSLIGIALLGYISGGRRVPWLVCAVAFGLIAVLHTGKTKMRTKYWEEQPAVPTTAQLPAYFSEWFSYGLESSGDKTVSHKLLERTSLMHILCLVVDYTPSRQDYLYGKSYTHVLPQLIPRILWKDKPRSHVATYELGIYYGLQYEEDTIATTIAFGLLTEAYANFGMLGAILLGAFWGFFLKKLQIWSTFSPMFSFAGLFMILLTAWSFNAELTMAAWISSLEQAVIVVLLVPMGLRALFGL